MSHEKDEQSRVLIVDDDEGTARTLALIFGRHGYQTATARSGREAIALALQSSFQVALLDIKLPDMAGIELLGPLKQTNPDLVAIMLTAFASVETAVRALNEGASAYLLKPVNMDEVLATVREGIHKQRLLAENRRLFAQAQEELARRQQAEEEREQLRTQLYQADRMASLGTLAASVAHEINNPLAYLLYNLESLNSDLPRVLEALSRLRFAAGRGLGAGVGSQILGELESFTAPELLEDIVNRARDATEGARRVLNIARDLRTFSHVQEDRWVPVSLNRVVECAINMAVHEFKYRARLVKEYGEVPTIMASEGRLIQVFLNLLVNAAQAIEDLDPERNEIRIRTWAEGEEVLVEVRDTGAGITEEDRERIFDPFFTTKPSGRGSGLGLSICHNIVAAYAGRIEVESAPGRGACFRVCLPQRQGEAEHGEAVTAPPLLEAMPPGTPRGRILVVDDEPNFGAAMVRMLKDEFDIVVATSGTEGQAILEHDTAFDVILCDMLMPKVTGMALYQWLAAREPEAARRVIFMTGGPFIPLARGFLQGVPNLNLEKPFDLKYLRGLLLEILQRREKEAS